MTVNVASREAFIAWYMDENDVPRRVPEQLWDEGYGVSIRWKARAKILGPNFDQPLSNLLAIIHEDGGDYQKQYGNRKACQDALEIVCTLRAWHQDRGQEIDRLIAECVDLRHQLAAALAEIKRLKNPPFYTA